MQRHIRSRRKLLPSLAIALIACHRPDAVSAPPIRATDAGLHRPDSTTDATAMTPAIHRITAAEATAHGLPAVGFHVDLTGQGMTPTLFPTPGDYLLLAGPPGATMMIVVSDAHGVVDRAGLLALTAAATPNGAMPRPQPGFGTANGTPPASVAGTIAIAGAPRDAVLTVSGQGMARVAKCIALLPAPSGGSTLSVTFRVGIGPTYQPADCSALLANPTVAAFAHSFAFD